MTPTVMETAATLRQSGRTPSVPFRIALDDGRPLCVQRLLRTLPGKRLTGVGELDGRPVLAKLFIAAHGSARHWERERQGLAALAARQIPTPRLLGAGALPAGGHYLLLEFLAGAQIPDPAGGVLPPVFETLGRMHACDLAQADAHLGNFLFWHDTLYVIDGDAIQTGITADAARRNLALLMAQLPVDRASADLLAAYRRGHPDGRFTPAQLEADMAAARQRRLDDYLDKCVRDCSLFKVERQAQRLTAMVRDAADFLAPIVADPDRWIEAGIPLKQGRTATLALIEPTGRRLVIKRYNIKGPGHALSRCWRPSRAWHSWVAGHRLDFLGIATPRPLALIEERHGPLQALRGRAWLITEYCAGENIAQRLASHVDTTPPAAELEALRKLFHQLVRAGISHGDLKATNLLWHAGQLSLIDLDALRQPKSAAAFARAWRKDRARFLRNWPADSRLRQALDEALPSG